MGINRSRQSVYSFIHTLSFYRHLYDYIYFLYQGESMSLSIMLNNRSICFSLFEIKLCYIFRPFREEYTGRDRFRSLAEGVESADIVTKLQSNGDIEFGELSIRDMDPEEIRVCL